MVEGKPALALWIVQQRKKQKWKLEELSRRLVDAGFEASPTTVRTWEAGRRPRAATIAAMERLFDSAAPELRRAVGSDEVAAALDRQAQAINDLVGELRLWREGDRARLSDVETTLARLVQERLSSPGSAERRTPRVRPASAG